MLRDEQAPASPHVLAAAAGSQSCAWFRVQEAAHSDAPLPLMQHTMPDAQLAAVLHLSAVTSPPPRPASGAAQVVPVTQLALLPF
jgi:hypothetical protein